MSDYFQSGGVFPVDSPFRLAERLGPHTITKIRCNACSHPYDPSTDICPGCGTWYKGERHFSPKIVIDGDRALDIESFEKVMREVLS